VTILACRVTILACRLKPIHCACGVPTEVFTSRFEPDRFERDDFSVSHDDFSVSRDGFSVSRDDFSVSHETNSLRVWCAYRSFHFKVRT
jgi:hypothetical protein